MSATQTARFATDADHRALAQFVADLAALDWREGVVRFTSCRRGARLCALGWLQMVTAASQSTRGFMSGAYHPATYKLTSAAPVFLAT